MQHIYDKIGRSTRAGAALFAMENGVISRSSLRLETREGRSVSERHGLAEKAKIVFKIGRQKGVSGRKNRVGQAHPARLGGGAAIFRATSGGSA